MNLLRFGCCLLITGFPGIGFLPAQDEPVLPPGLRVERGAIHGVSISNGDSTVAIYRAPSGEAPSALLLTHARRGIVEAARESGSADLRLIAPAACRKKLEAADDHWQAWWTERFDSYVQRVTKRPVHSLPASRYVEDGDELVVAGRAFTVLETPGYTPDGVTYLTTMGGKRIAFTGNLLWKGGRAFDLYSFQNRIREAKIGAYHGYAGRFAPWIASLQKLAEANPDLVVPSRGPLITEPRADIGTAIERARAIYANYISTNALHWYFGEERMSTAFHRVVGPEAFMDSMPLCEHVDLPGWIRHIGTTKLLVSESRRGFVLDVGGSRSLQTLEKILDDGLVTAIDGIWVTHLHNDHTRSVATAQERFRCPVYAVAQVARGLERPGELFTPGLSPNAVEDVTTLEEKETLEWEEFALTARWFPGQMRRHGGLLVRKPHHEPVFFIGDSFSPSGIDDYCLMNRNLLHEDDGYRYCFRVVRKEMPPDTWLVNQHIPHLFRFDESEWTFLESRYRERIKRIRAFVPWDDPNYAVDEQWVWPFPYGQEAAPGETVSLDFRVRNHSPRQRRFALTLHPPDGITAENATASTAPGAGEAGSCRFELRLAKNLTPRVHVVTASVRSADGEIDLPHWNEALIRVVPASGGH